MKLLSIPWQAAGTRKWLAYLFLVAFALFSTRSFAAMTPITASQAHWLSQQPQPVCAAGENENGELGDATAVNRSVPVPVVNSSAFTGVSTGWYHSVAVKSDGTVWAWGYNGYGELGDGSTSNSPTPLQVPGLTGFIAVAAGQYHSLALKSDGTVVAWGYNGYGELGNGTTSQSLIPVEVIGLSNVHIVAIAAGEYHSLALDSNGNVWAWGYNGYGQLGNGTTTSEPSPVQVAALSGVTTIAAGANHSLAILSDGTVRAWGNNSNGELGDGSTTSRANIVTASGLSNVSAIAGGDNHSLAVETNGTVWAWGYNGYGQLGDGTQTQRVTPVQIPNLSGGKAVAGGTAFSVLLATGGIYSWGDNTYGELANDSTVSSIVPVKASACVGVPTSYNPPASMTHRVAASQYFSLAVKNDGTVESFGQNNNGQLGDGTTINRSTPVRASGLSGIVGVGAGWYHGLAVQNNGTVWAWGYNGYGELGSGSYSSSPTPLPVPNFGGAIQVAAGQYHSLALKNDGTVWAWGYNGYGQLGIGSTTQQPSPLQVIGLTGIVSIAAGEYHSLALKNDGTVWAWGNNGSGQLGDGTTNNQTSPVQVADLSGVSAIAAGANHSLAIVADGGTVWTWGYNGYGQLGDGSTTSRPNIVRASGLTGVSAIAGGDTFSLAVKIDGTVWSWGYNGDGELGNGSSTGSNVPVQVNYLNKALTVAAGTAHALALNNDGTISAWGLNNYGQFGEASPASSTVPVTTSVPGVGPFYKLMIGVSPADSGTVTASPSTSDSIYQTGTTVCLAATPASGYIFSGWSGTPLNASNCLTLDGNASVTANFTPAGLRFIPVTPCRVVDTRNSTAPFGGPPLAADATREFEVPQSACSIPTSALAYSLNVTVVPTHHLQYLTVWPTGQSQPNVSTLNSPDGRIKANAAVVPAGTNGGVSVFATDATNVIVDINGYFVPKSDTSALGFYPVKPCRIADTRSGSGSLGGPSLTAGESRTFPVLSSSCELPSTAKAYSLNFTAVPKGTLNYLTVWPAGDSQPNVSTLNAPTGTVTANAALVPAGSSGSIDVYASNATDLIIDVNGYFATPQTGALSLYTLVPCRVLDTRNPPGSQPFSGTKTVNVSATSCNVPTTATDMVFNATVVPPAALDYLTLWATGQTQPTVSTLNALDGSITSNLAIVPAANGSVDAFASNPTQLILDIFGYFAP